MAAVAAIVVGFSRTGKRTPFQRLAGSIAMVLCLLEATIVWAPRAAADEPLIGAFECQESAGVVAWTDHGQGKYWIYRSIDGGVSYAWLGRTLGATVFIDPTPAPGFTYQVHYEGIPRSNCMTLSDNGPALLPTATPAPTLAEPFSCGEAAGVLTWTDHGQDKYWVYRSVDAGASYSWLDRTYGATTVADLTSAPGYRYQVHYQGMARSHCVDLNAPTTSPTATSVPPTATPPPTPTAKPSPTNNGVLLFDGFGQTGAATSYGEGVFAAGSSPDRGVYSQTSSLSVNPGYIVLLCTRATGGGQCRAVKNSQNDLSNFGLNDAISYLQVRKLGDPFVLSPGNDLKQIVNRLPADTSFTLQPGVYVGESIYPKDGMSFVGEPGAILDGDGVSSPAFGGPGDRVVIRSLEIRNYTGLGHFTGAINARDLEDFGIGGADWVVEENEIHHNSSVGVSVHDGMLLRNNDIHHNGQIGISGVSNADHPLIDLEISGNLVHDNADGSAPRVLHEGGMKIVGAHDSVISGNVVSHNQGMGIWCDIGCLDVLIEDNIVSGNTMYYDSSPGYGIFYEISARGTIRNNTVHVDFNGLYRFNCCGIVVGEAQDVLVERNEVTVTGSTSRTFNALGVRQCCPGHRSDPIATFYNNTVNGAGVVANVGSITDAELASSSFTFDYNSYRGDYALRFNGDRSQAWWHGEGWDLGGDLE